MAKGAKKLAANYRVPQDDGEANGFIHALGEVRRELALSTAAMNDELARVRLGHEQAAEPLKEREKALLLGLEAYASANRDRLTGGGKVKFHQFASGFVRWRARPPKVSIRSAETVVETLRALGLGRFIRTKEEPNKEAMLAEPEIARGVAGVSIGSEGEDFVVEPHEEELAKGAAA